MRLRQLERTIVRFRPVESFQCTGAASICNSCPLCFVLRTLLAQEPFNRRLSLQDRKPKLELTETNSHLLTSVLGRVGLGKDRVRRL